MRTLVLLLIVLIGVPFTRGLDDHLRYVESYSPFPFELDAGFKKRFLELTGFQPQLLVRKMNVFRVGSRVGCWLAVSAVVLHEGQSMYDHRAFMATREASEADWNQMKLYTLPSQFGERLAGDEDEEWVDEVVAKYGRPVTKEMILDSLIGLNGE